MFPVQVQAVLNGNISIPPTIRIHKQRHFSKHQNSYLYSSRECIFSLEILPVFLGLNVRFSYTAVRRGISFISKQAVCLPTLKKREREEKTLLSNLTTYRFSSILDRMTRVHFISVHGTTHLGDRTNCRREERYLFVPPVKGLI